MSIVHKALKKAENEGLKKDQLKNGTKTGRLLNTERPPTQRIVVIMTIFCALLAFGIYFPSYYKSRALKKAKESITVKPPAALPTATETAKRQEPTVTDSRVDITPEDLDGNVSSLNKRGIYFFSIRDYDGARVFFLSALEKDSRNHELYNNLGLTLKVQHKYKDALRNYQLALSLNEGYKEGHNNLGVLYDELGRHNNAIDSFKKAIKLDADYPDPHLNAAITYEKMGKYKSALKYYKNYLEFMKDKENGLVADIKKKMAILRKL